MHRSPEGTRVPVVPVGLILAMLLAVTSCTPLPKYTGPGSVRLPKSPSPRTGTPAGGATSTPATTAPKPNTPPGPPPKVQRAGNVPTGPERWGDHYLRGLSSWYGRDFHGKKTANGETFDMYKLTAAHRTLPLGTRARIWNVENGRSCIVVINDRGPFIEGRILDLSYAAALELEMAGKGVAMVQIEILQLPPAPEGLW